MVVERSTAKDPDERYQDVGEMIDDLSTALEVEAARAGSTTGEATSVLDAVPPPKRKLSSRGALVVGGDRPAGPGRRRGAAGDEADLRRGLRRRRRQQGKGGVIQIDSATDYDPQGDGEEGGDEVGFAVDGNPTGTAWETEHYDTETFAGTKTGPNPGVGIYVTTTSPATPKRMIVPTPTSGWDAEVFAAASGPPEELSEWGDPVGEVVDASDVDEVDLESTNPRATS